MSGSQPWRSSEALDPSWAPPSPAAPPPAEAPRRHRSRWLIVGVPLLALAVVIGLVAALGGFGTRTDRLITVPAGETISTGPLDYTFTKATVQQKDSLGKQIHEVIVYGTARTTGEEGMRPQSDQFVGRDDVDRTVKDPEIAKIGTAENYANGATLTPGLPPVDFRVEFEFPNTWQPSPTFRIGIADLQFEKLFFGGEDPHWENDSRKTYQVKLPVQVLPAER